MSGAALTEAVEAYQRCLSLPISSTYAPHDAKRARQAQIKSHLGLARLDFVRGKREISSQSVKHPQTARQFSI